MVGVADLTHSIISVKSKVMALQHVIFSCNFTRMIHHDSNPWICSHVMDIDDIEAHLPPPLLPNILTTLSLSQYCFYHHFFFHACPVMHVHAFSTWLIFHNTSPKVNEIVDNFLIAVHCCYNIDNLIRSGALHTEMK